MNLRQLYNEIKLIKGPLSIFNSLKLGNHYLLDISFDNIKRYEEVKLMNKYKEFDNEKNEILVIEFLVLGNTTYYSRKTYSDLNKNNEKWILINNKRYINSLNSFLTINSPIKE